MVCIISCLTVFAPYCDSHTVQAVHTVQCPYSTVLIQCSTHTVQYPYSTVPIRYSTHTVQCPYSTHTVQYPYSTHTVQCPYIQYPYSTVPIQYSTHTVPLQYSAHTVPIQYTPAQVHDQSPLLKTRPPFDFAELLCSLLQGGPRTLEVVWLEDTLLICMHAAATTGYIPVLFPLTQLYIDHC